MGAVGFYAAGGWQQGLAVLGPSLASFLGALWLAVKYHGRVAGFLTDKFGLPTVWTNVLGYLTVGILAEAVLSDVISWATAKLPEKIGQSKTNRWLGAVTAGANALVILAFILILILALPIRGTIKQDIRNSVIGKYLVVSAEKYGGEAVSSIDRAAKEAVRFLTVQPTSKEKIPLTIEPKSSQLRADETSERRMAELVNAERSKAGLAALRVDTAIIPVARAHSRDMFERRYFSHINPEGEDVGDRLIKGGVKFSVAGENLAYAPDLATAHEGLMNSEGHRANILSADFGRIGIGIIDGGIYGIMVTQVFAD